MSNQLAQQHKYISDEYTISKFLCILYGCKDIGLIDPDGLRVVGSILMAGSEVNSFCTASTYSAVMGSGSCAFVAANQTSDHLLTEF